MIYITESMLDVIIPINQAEKKIEQKKIEKAEKELKNYENYIINSLLKK